MSFDYCFVAKGIGSKKQLVNKKDLNIEAGLPDNFISLFWYDEEAVAYWQKFGELGGYRGRMAINYLPFDVDAPTLEEACEIQRKLIYDLNAKGIYNYKISFSGKKGFHTMVPAAYFGGFKPSNSLPQQLLSLAKQITTAKFDRAIYSHLRLFRLQNSVHGGSGLHKVQIEQDMVNRPQDILEYAKIPRPTFPIQPAIEIPVLVDVKEKSFSMAPEYSKFESKNPKIKKCIQYIFEHGVKQGQRNDAVLVLASHFKDVGLDLKTIQNIILEWNKKIGLDTNEVINTIKSAWDGNYTHGCFHWLLDDYCNKECFLYRNKYKVNTKTEEEDIKFYTWTEARAAYTDFQKDQRGIKLYFSKKIDDMIKRLSPGDVFSIIGRPGAYKSTLAQIIGNNYVENQKDYVLLYSLEMNLTRLFEREAQIIYDEPISFVESNYESLEFSDNQDRFLLATKKNIGVEDIKKSIVNWEETTGNKIGLVLVDFLHALKSEGTGETQKIKNAMLELKNLPHELDTVLGILVHTSREGGGDSYKPLNKSSARDTSSVEDLSDFMLGCYDEKTQVLTASGWKYFKDLTGDQLLTFNQETKFLEYKNYYGYIEYDYNGLMHHYHYKKEKSFDLMVTPNHNMVVTHRLKKDKFELIESQNLIHNHCTPRKTNGIQIESKKNITIGDNTYNLKEFCKLVGFFVGDGSLSLEKEQSKKYKYPIYFGLKKERKIKYFKNILKTLKIDYVVNNVSSRESFMFKILDENFYGFFKKFYNDNNEKTIPRVFLNNLSLEENEALFEGLMNSDGHVNKNGGKIYYTSSKELKNIVEEIILKIGFGVRTSFRQRKSVGSDKIVNCYEIFVLKSNFITLLKTLRNDVYYKGKVYCVEVPNHAIFVKRNDAITICGNCHLVAEDDTAMKVQLLKNKNGRELPVGVVMERSSRSVALYERDGDYLPIEEDDNF